MSGPTKLLVLGVVLLFGLALFVLGVDMVVSPNVYDWLLPNGFVAFLGQTLMFLAFMLTFGIIAFLSGLLRFSDQRPAEITVPPVDILGSSEESPEKEVPSWEDLPGPSASKPTPAVPDEELPHLIGLTGGLPNRLTLTKGTFTIGRDPECELVLSSQMVSRRHAQLEWTGEELLIHDLGSSNQTRVNDKVLEKEIGLEDGDVIQIVDYHLEVELPIPQSKTVLIPREPVEGHPTVHTSDSEDD